MGSPEISREFKDISLFISAKKAVRFFYIDCTEAVQHFGEFAS